MKTRSAHTRKRMTIIIASTFFIVAIFVFKLSSLEISGANLGSQSLLLNNYNTGVTTNYKIAFNYVTAGNVGSVKLEFCSNDPAIGNFCTAPNGFDASNAQINSQSGTTGFSIGLGTNANTVILSKNISAVNVGSASYNLSGIKNPTQSGTYFLRIQTFASNDATGPSSDNGKLAFSILNDFTVTATIPPYLAFCTGIIINNLDCATASGDIVDFGELSTNVARQGSSQMLVASNAELGFNITFQGTTLTSGNNIISAIANNDISRPGTSQFGLNLRANNAPPVGKNPTGPGNAQPSFNYNQPNFYRFVPGETLVNTSGTSDARLFTMSYIANINSTQPPGIYVSTLTYICFANF